jgi:hypothetical protein
VRAIGKQSASPLTQLAPGTNSEVAAGVSQTQPGGILWRETSCMAGQTQSCELCKKAPRRSTETLLCRDCAEAVSQVMPCELYEANHGQDRQAQLAQMRLLVKAATSGK